MTMQAAPGNGAAAGSTPDAPSTNGPSAIPKHYRYSSRSNSFSSASVVTVKRTGSLSSSGTGSRNSALPLRAQSPGETSLIALHVARDQVPQDRTRRKSVAVDATERPDSGILGSLHAHSSSTASSVASGANSRRSRASSGALLGGLREQTSSPKKRGAGTIDYSPRPHLSRASSSTHSIGGSPERERRPRPELTNPLNSLPSLNATPALTDPYDSESPSTIQTVTTPSTQASYKPDYFVEHNTSPSNNVKSQPLASLRNPNGPLAASEDTRMQETESAFSATPVKSSIPKLSKIDTAASVAAQENGRRKPRSREKGEKEKKVMLAQALQRANAAVYLDNSQNFEGAMLAYTDACNLLQQVMERSSGADDKRKLEAIRSTYTSRIDELLQMDLSQAESSDEKILPARPISSGSSNGGSALASPTIVSAIQHSPVFETDVLPGAIDEAYQDERPIDLDADRARNASNNVQRELLPAAELKAPSAITTHERAPSTELPPPRSLLRISSPVRTEVLPTPISTSHSSEEKAMLIPLLQTNILRPPPTPEDIYMPAPLSPKRLNSPKRDIDSQTSQVKHLPVLPHIDVESSAITLEQPGPQSLWLDTIDEDRSSRASSVHSVSSQQGLRRKHLRPVSVASNADFDAAFDAAVEAAYDQGLEPDLEGAKSREDLRRTHMSNESINVRSSEIAEIGSPGAMRRLYGDPVLSADEEEERLMDAIAQDYGRGFTFDISSKSALPRTSDSSGYSRSTWQSSLNSDRTTAGTSLSTVAEDASPNLGSKNAFAASSSMNSMLAEPSHPPPTHAPQPPSHPPPAVPPPQTSLPPPPTTLPLLTGAVQNRLSGVRSRRLSGQNPKQLKIETPGKSDTRQRASTFHHTSSPFNEDEELPHELSASLKAHHLLEPLTASDSAHSDILKSPPSLELHSAVSDSSRPVTATTFEHRHSMDEDPSESLSHRPTLIKKNKSSMSMREHMVLLASPTVENGPSLMTPLSSTFMTFSKRNETPLTSQRATLPSFGSAAAEDILLFSTSLTAPDAASSPKLPATPVSVEACPESFLLRPFWLMRNIATTLTHPKGGFLTSQLFVPREVWQTKGVKLKSIEDKIATCDLLTAALGRLAGVDTYDADAVMDELQIFEDVMDRVQSTLVKKLGSEVGVGGLSGIFKDAPTTTHGSSTALASDASTIRGKDGKGLGASWRKLRSKSSGAPNTTSTPIGKGLHKVTSAGEQDAFNMPSVPMTSWISVERRGHKKDVRNMVFEGEHRHYMSSLASLFESVQVLDQIARQVEDPGLKAASSTHVGMELSIRHAAEFFGFYICRFVLADVGTLLDKFVKRGSEWVLA